MRFYVYEILVAVHNNFMSNKTYTLQIMFVFVHQAAVIIYRKYLSHSYSIQQELYWNIIM